MGEGRIVRMVTSLHPTIIYWKDPKKDVELRTLVLAICADEVLLVVVVIALVVMLKKLITNVDVM